MRSIGNDVKSTNVDSSSSITQTHLDDLDKSRDTHQAAAIATESTARNTAIITAIATETSARNTAIATVLADSKSYTYAEVAIEVGNRTAAITAVLAESEAYTGDYVGITEAYTDAKVSTAHTEIAADGYFDKIITSNTNISNMGFPIANEDAGFAQKDHAHSISYALLQDKHGKTSINTANGKKINLKIDGSTKANITSTTTTFNNQMTIKNATISDAGWSNTNTNGNMAVFSHKDRATINNYAFMQHSAGTTYINSGDHEPSAGTGQINLRINDTDVTTFTSTAANFIVPITGTSDRRFKKNITAPSPSKNFTGFN